MLVYFTSSLPDINSFAKNSAQNKRNTPHPRMFCSKRITMNLVSSILALALVVNTLGPMAMANAAATAATAAGGSGGAAAASTTTTTQTTATNVATGATSGGSATAAGTGGAAAATGGSGAGGAASSVSSGGGSTSAAATSTGQQGGPLGGLFNGAFGIAAMPLNTISSSLSSLGVPTLATAPLNAVSSMFQQAGTIYGR